MEHNDVMNEKYINTCNYLNYVEHLLILSSAVTGWLSISAFASLVCIPVGLYKFCSKIKNLCNHCRIQKASINHQENEEEA